MSTWGSAHDEAELEALKAAAQQWIAAGQLELDLGLEPAGGGPLPITSSRMGHLLDALEHGCRLLGLEDAAAGTRCSGTWCWPDHRAGQPGPLRRVHALLRDRSG